MDRYMNIFLDLSYDMFTHSRETSQSLTRELQDEQDRLRRDLLDCRADCLVVIQERDKLRRELLNKCKEREAALMEKDEISRCYEEARVEIREGEARASKLQNEIDRLASENSILKFDNRRFCVSAKKLAEEISSLKNRLSNCQQEVKRERESVGAWKTSSEVFERRCYNLRNRLIHIQDAIGDDDDGEREGEGKEEDMIVAENGGSGAYENISEDGADSDGVVYISTGYENDV